MERTVKVYDNGNNQYDLKIHWLKKSELEEELNEVQIDGKSYFISNEDLKQYHIENQCTVTKSGNATKRYVVAGSWLKNANSFTDQESGKRI